MINLDAVAGLGLSKIQLDLILEKLPEGVTYQLRHYANELFLAGGAIRAILNGEPINDVDLFAATPIAATPIAASGAANFLRCGTPSERLHVTINAYTVKDVTPYVQIIRREYYPTARAVLDSFDFVVCKAAIWWDGTGWTSLVDPDFFNDLEQAKLTYCAPEGQDPRDSLLRVLKFAGRGYSIDARSLAKVITQTVANIQGCIDTLHLEDGLAADFSGTEDLAAQRKSIRVCGSSRK